VGRYEATHFETFYDRAPFNQTLYYFACLRAGSGTVTVRGRIVDPGGASRPIGPFPLTGPGAEVSLGRSPAGAPDPGFTVPDYCPGP
jgi:hypothetical protein